MMMIFSMMISSDTVQQYFGIRSKLKEQGQKEEKAISTPPPPAHPPPPQRLGLFMGTAKFL